MNKTLLIGGLLTTATLVLVLAAGFGHDTRKIKSPLIGRQAPPFALARVDGKGTVSLESLKGKPAVVNFWATWCVPCQEEHEVLQAMAVQTGSRAQFVGIVYDDEPDRITDFLKRTGGTTYPTIIDQGGKAAIAYGVYGVPETFFLNAQGKIVSKFEGPLSPEELHGRLAEIGATL
jgi:cytochrome c biogenesis protein CcmG/thiol:disulfide interchange protein DsbE